MRLYLVRRNLEQYLGPMNISELRSAYSRMEFGLEDEVASHLGRWVKLDNMSLLKQIYPEVAHMMKQGIKENWAVSPNSIHSKIKIKKDKAKERLRTKKRKKTSSTPKYVVAMLIVATLCVGGYYLYQNEDIKSKILGSLDVSSTDQVEKMFADSDTKAFDEYMNQALPTIIPKIAKSRSEYNTWIPYIRYLAFRQDGKINGVKAKLLRGMGKFSAPTDCSVDAWQSRWTEDNSNWHLFLNGDVIGTTAWTKLLLWDPHWIKRRNKVDGWKKPRNYYEACLITAQKSLETLDEGWHSTYQNPEIIRKFVTRIKAMLSIIRGELPLMDQKRNDILSDLSCIDIANTKDELNQCPPFNTQTDVWKNYRNTRKLRSELRIILKQKGNVSSENLIQLSKLQEGVKTRDELTEFDYSGESKYITTLLLNNGSIRESLKKMNYDFSEVDFEQ